MAKERLTIVLDAGHGGNDPGAVDPIDLEEDDGIYQDEIYSEESDLNLKAAKMLKRIFELKTEHEIVMTRTEDKYVKLGQRTHLANQKKADLFISIHANAATPGAKGIETLCYPTSAGGNRLAELVQYNIIDELDAVDRGVKHRDNLYVLRKTHMPAILLEMGFMTNVEEEILLNNEDYMCLMMNKVADGVQEYFRG